MFEKIGLTFQRIAVTLFTGILFLLGCMMGTNHSDLQKDYVARVEGLTVLENDMDTALPQTEVYTYVYDHLHGALPAGKTAKKAIVIGYDGCRLDALSLMDDAHDSAIRALLADGGKVYTCYCGGKPYPAINTQFTSTAPGWCTMLIGAWAKEAGVVNNGQPKPNDRLTLLTTAVQDGTIGSSAFYVSWDGHFVDSDSTYVNELRYIQDKGLNVNFSDAGDDDGTRDNVLADLARENCSDFIFTILEYTDHTGHDTGFCVNNPDYVEAFYSAEASAMQIVEAVKSRPTYDTEDWLILITSDHGGYNTWHGMCTLQERMTFIAANKPYGGDFDFGAAK